MSSQLNVPYGIITENYYFCLTAVFQLNLDELVSFGPPSVAVPEENFWGSMELIFYGLDVLSATQPSVSKH